MAIQYNTTPPCIAQIAGLTAHGRTPSEALDRLAVMLRAHASMADAMAVQAAEDAALVPVGVEARP
jgi:hypothetical protein